jgi:hypothetical protein
MTRMSKDKNPVRRVLLSEKEANRASLLLEKLRESSCKVDTSKLINEIVSLFFDKYEEVHFDDLKTRFIDQKSLLKKLISDSTSENLEDTIRSYLSEKTGKKSKRRRRKKVEVTMEKNEATGS